MTLTSRLACVICPKPTEDAPMEFRFGWEQLRHLFAANTLFVNAGAHDAARSVSGVGLADTDHVLLMLHSHAVVMPEVIQRLAQSLQASSDWTATLAHDQHFAPTPAPDYCTVRGLQRYLQRLAQQPATAIPFTGQHEPLLALTTAGAVRRGSVMQQAMWLSHAHVHDFSDYHQATRDEVIPLVPAHARRVLDVGGGEGGYLRRLQQARAATTTVETHLAELSVQACAAAQGWVERVWQGDFSTLPIETRFDCITFLEALEHTADPAHWLRRARELLAPGGAVVASVPNVGHWSVVADLLEGHWDYSPVGIHCVTHLRFFTERGLRDLFDSVGLRIERLERITVACPDIWREAWSDPQRASAGLHPNRKSWDTYAFMVQAFA